MPIEPIDETLHVGLNDAEIKPVRLISLDAYRGFVMLAMASAGLGLVAVADRTGHPVWRFLARQNEHVEWRGCVFWDLIQPSFMFIVGVAMPWAYANRKAAGQGWWTQFEHALGRSFILILLGVFLASNGASQTNWAFTNVLTQIGLGYPFVFLILGWRPAWQFAAAIAVLVGYWAFFAFWPLAGSGGTWPTMPSLDTLPAHWAKGTNAAADFDFWLLNRLPYPDGHPFSGNTGGYTTLNFIPSIATAIFGVLVGRLLKGPGSDRWKLRTLLIAGVTGLGTGWLLDTTVCPIVKRVWSPSWTLFSAGWACLMMAGFLLVVDIWQYRRFVFPLVVVGSNSIAIYLMAQLMKPWIRQTLRTHLTTAAFVCDQWLGMGPSAVPGIERSGGIFGGTYGPILDSLAVLSILWLICLWLYRRKIFLKV